MQVMTTVKVSVPEVMVHGQFSGICWHSLSIPSQFGGVFSRFCGIYNVFNFNISVNIIKELQFWDSISRSSVANNFLQFKNC